MAKEHKSEAEIKKIAVDFVKKLIKKPLQKQATIVGLYGDLGAGKTTFTKSATKALKIKESVSSPTFVIIRTYNLRQTTPALPAGRYDKFIHIDAYRLKNKKEMLHLGWKELASDPKNLIFIEWPENITKLIPKNAIKIILAHRGEGKREIKINNFS